MKKKVFYDLIKVLAFVLVPLALFSCQCIVFIDCCDGSDEFDGSIICHNTCVMGGHVAYNTINYESTTADDVKVTGKGVISEDSTQKLQGIIL